MKRNPKKSAKKKKLKSEKNEYTPTIVKLGKVEIEFDVDDIEKFIQTLIIYILVQKRGLILKEKQKDRCMEFMFKIIEKVVFEIFDSLHEIEQILLFEFLRENQPVKSQKIADEGDNKGLEFALMARLMGLIQVLFLGDFELEDFITSNPEPEYLTIFL